MVSVLKKKKERNRRLELEKQLNNHPAKEVSPVTKMLYINGLAFLAGIDENVDETEKEYLNIISKILKIDDVEFEVFLKTAENQDLETFDEVINVMSKEEKLKLNFMYDIHQFAEYDGKVSKEENELIKYFYDNLKINKEQKKIINYVIQIVKSNDKDFLISFYAAYKDKYFEQFEYLFNNNHMVVSEIIDEIYHFEWTEWKMTLGHLDGGRLVATKPVTYHQYLIYINYLVITGEIKHPDFEFKDTDKFKHSDNRVITTSEIDAEVLGYKIMRAVEFTEWLSQKIVKDITVSIVKIKLKRSKYQFLESNKNKPQTLAEVFVYNEDPVIHHDEYYEYQFGERACVEEKKPLAWENSEDIYEYELNYRQSHTFRLMKIEG
jgi:uncharacterized tellurite resistance protein B-like protein